MTRSIYNFEFGEYVLNGGERVLLRNGKPVSVPPKALHLLAVLIENHNRLVEKDRLMETVWADSFVEEGNLTFTIGLLRKLLGDRSKDPRFIATVPKRGYRFIADVRQIESHGSNYIDRYSERITSLENSVHNPRGAVWESTNSGSVVAIADWRRPENVGDMAVDESPGCDKTPSPVGLEIRDVHFARQKPRVETNRRLGFRRGRLFFIRGVILLFLFMVLFEILSISSYNFAEYRNTLSSPGTDPRAESMANLLQLFVFPLLLMGALGVGFMLFGICRTIYAMFETDSRKINPKYIERVFTVVIILVIALIAVPNLITSFRRAVLIDQQGVPSQYR